MARRKFSRMGEEAPSPVLENFLRAILPAPTDCPWVSKDDAKRETTVRPSPVVWVFALHL